MKPDWKPPIEIVRELQDYYNMMLDDLNIGFLGGTIANNQNAQGVLAQKEQAEQILRMFQYKEQQKEENEKQRLLLLVMTNPLRFAQLECGYCHKDLRTNEFEKRIVEVTAENNRPFLAHDVCVAITQQRIVDLDRNPVRNLIVKPARIPETEEVEYTYFSLEWLQQMPNEFFNRFIRTIHENGGALQQDIETKSLIIVDDNMTDVGITTIAEMLEGHGAQTRKVKVLKKWMK